MLLINLAYPLSLQKYIWFKFIK